MTKSLRILICNIELMREERGWTLMEVAEAADMPFNTLNSFLYGNVNAPRLINVDKLANGFGVSASDMLSESMAENRNREKLLKTSYANAAKELDELEKNIKEIRKTLQKYI